jgi:hypothetical protein
MLASISQALSFLREALQRTWDYAWQRSAPRTRSAASNRTFATLGYDTLESRSWNKRASIQFHLQTEVSMGIEC